MDYQRIYNNIIEKAKSEDRKKKQGIYYERHHIIPKCLNGTNDKENLVLLTGREHYICHKLLIKIYPNNNKLSWALHRMGFSKKYKLSSYDFSDIRNMIAIIQKQKNLSTETKNKIRNTILGTKQSKETKEKHSKSVLGCKNSFYNKHHTDETKEILKIKKRKYNVSLDIINNIKKDNLSVKQLTLKYNFNHAFIRRVIAGEYDKGYYEANRK